MILFLYFYYYFTTSELPVQIHQPGFISSNSSTWIYQFKFINLNSSDISSSESLILASDKSPNNRFNILYIQWKIHSLICDYQIFTLKNIIFKIQIHLLYKLICISGIIHPSSMFPICNLSGMNIKNCKIRVDNLNSPLFHQFKWLFIFI